MKKLLLFITVLFFGISTINAQDDASYGYEAGDWVLGGGDVRRVIQGVGGDGLDCWC